MSLVIWEVGRTEVAGWYEAPRMDESMRESGEESSIQRRSMQCMLRRTMWSNRPVLFVTSLKTLETMLMYVLNAEQMESRVKRIEPMQVRMEEATLQRLMIVDVKALYWSMEWERFETNAPFQLKSRRLGSAGTRAWAWV